jgi:acetyl-CoA decarbonylase/synthase complex subunit gamma
MLETCPPLLEKKYRDMYKNLWGLLKPPIKAVKIGTGDSALTIGGEFVMYRHELAYINPTAIAIDVTDELPRDELLQRIREVEAFSYPYLGEELKLDLIAVRSTSNNPGMFRTAVKKVVENTNVPLVLCSSNPKVLDAGLKRVPGKRPLIYAASENNWKELAKLAMQNECPLTVFASNDIHRLRIVTKKLMECGITDLVLDPGTFPYNGLRHTVNNFTSLRWLACREGDELLGRPLIGTPITAWEERQAPEVAKWWEASLASILITQYADILIMHTMDGWAMLPPVILRQNLYSDPRKPAAVDPGLRILGTPDKNAPVMFTTNFVLTYFTVSSDIESAGISCYLLIIDSEGVGVQSAAARANARKGGLTGEMVAKAIQETGVEERVKHRTLIIPGLAANIKGAIEELTGWNVLVGPSNSGEIPKFLEENWINKEEKRDG